jgi:CP family cyanate transporter-like MFS transporter
VGVTGRLDQPRPVRPATLLVGLLALALNLRIALAGYPPLLQTVRAALGITAGVAGLVQAGAVVMMGVASFLAPALAGRLGWERALGVSVGVLAVGSLVRIVPTLTALIGGNLLVGLGIGGAGVLMAGVVKHHLASRVGVVTGAYVVAMMVGAGVTSAVAVPLAVGLGGWSFSLAVWAVPAALAVGLWWPLAARTGGRDRSVTRRHRLPWRNGFARLATLFLAMSSVQYYGWLTWLAPYYEHLGWSNRRAALLEALWLVAQIPVALVVSLLAERRRRWVFWAALTAAGGVAGELGALLLPVPPMVGPWAWVLLSAVGGGAGFSLGLSVIAWRTGHAAEAGAISGLALGVGYLLAGVAPPLMGLLIDATGGYRVPLGVLVAAGSVQLVAAALIGNRPALGSGGIRDVPPSP